MADLGPLRLGLQGDAYASDWFPTWFAQLLPLSQAWDTTVPKMCGIFGQVHNQTVVLLFDGQSTLR
jgi:hypothetical protein